MVVSLRQWFSGILVAGFLLAGGGSAWAGLPPDVPERAYGEGSVDEDNPRVETRLLVDREQVVPGGSFRVGVLFSIDPDWHVYWRHSGDAGMPTNVRWKGEGLEFGETRWPAPHAKEESGGEVVTFGYSSEVLLFTEATVPEDAEGPLEVGATVDYLTCKVDCIPGSGELARRVSVGETPDEASEKERELFAQYDRAVPKGAGELGIDVRVAYSQKPVRPGDTFRAAVGLDYCAEGPDSCNEWSVAGSVPTYRFIPAGTAQVTWKTLEVRDHPTAKRGAVLALEGKANANEPEEEERLSGVVWLEEGDGDETPILVEASLPRGSSGAEIETVESPLLTIEGGGPPESPGRSSASRESDDARATGSRIGFWRALLFAFLGGMILNLMPCVFPVLALKVTSFAELVHEDRSHALLHGAAYAVGIVGSMLVLAVVVLGLRYAGTEVGWGFQFQNPVFPSVLAAAVVLFALNLFGVFEIQVSASSLAQTTQQASGLRRSVGEGILAVVLATPCSAPFLGTAVGFALTSSAPTVLVMFTALGLGLAAPFVVLMLVPGWSQVLPDPGPWMVQIRNVLGFVLIGAAVWLVWIAGRTIGVDAMAAVLVFLAVVAFAGWVYGSAQESDWSPAAALVGAAGGGVLWAEWELLSTTSLGVALQIVALVGGGLVMLATVAVASPSARQFAGLALGAAVLSTVGVGSWALDFEADPGDWEPWSDERVERALEKGRPVFVDFTADWCITCKVNERTVLSTETVREGFRRYDVATLKADWTDGDPVIQEKLKSFGQAGVPMYLVYSPEAPDDPEVLPQVLTPETVVGAVEQARGSDSE